MRLLQTFRFSRELLPRDSRRQKYRAFHTANLVKRFGQGWSQVAPGRCTAFSRIAFCVFRLLDQPPRSLELWHFERGGERAKKGVEGQRPEAVASKNDSRSSSVSRLDLPRDGTLRFARSEERAKSVVACKNRGTERKRDPFESSAPQLVPLLRKASFLLERMTRNSAGFFPGRAIGEPLWPWRVFSD